jgi:tetratricopeptide (TPR) repeat protein
VTRLLAELIVCLVPAGEVPDTPNRGATRSLVELIARGASAAAPADEWVGQTVFPRKIDVQLFDDKREKVIGTWAVTEGSVLAENGVWVEVRHLNYPGPYQGWVKKRDVVKTEDAVAFFSGELTRDKKTPWLYQIRAEVWGAKGEHDSAMRDLDEAIRLAPGDAPLFVVRGSIFVLKGEHFSALAAYSEAVRLDPKSVTAFYNRGRAYAEKGNYDKAIDDFAEAIRLDPKDYPAWAGRGTAYALKGEYHKALADYTEAIRLDPKYALLYANRSQAHEEFGDYKKALDDLAEAVRLDSKLIDAVGRYGWLLATCPDARYRDGTKAIVLARNARELAGKSPGWHHYAGLAAAYAEAGDFEMAVAYEKKALEYDVYAQSPAADFRMNLYKQKRPYHQDTRMPPPRK